MSQGINKIIKQGKFKVVYSSAKKYLCDEGELTLTKNNFSLKCGKGWTRIFLNEHVRLGVWEGYLEIHDSWYGKLLFKLAVDEPIIWRESFNKIQQEKLDEDLEDIFLVEGKVSVELKKILICVQNHSENCITILEKRENNSKEKTSNSI